ncbi:hypothetical protein ACFV4N_14840 [Actinosynnema sp. NPDC059797]
MGGLPRHVGQRRGSQRPRLPLPVHHSTNLEQSPAAGSLPATKLPSTDNTQLDLGAERDRTSVGLVTPSDDLRHTREVWLIWNGVPDDRCRGATDNGKRPAYDDPSTGR